jgi:hypothetical protein
MCLNETYCKVHIGTHLSDISYPKWSKTRRCSRPPILNFALEYAIRKVQENQVGLKWNGIHQLQAYAADDESIGR